MVDRLWNVHEELDSLLVNGVDVLFLYLRRWRVQQL